MRALIYIGSFLIITAINILIGMIFGFSAGSIVVFLLWYWIARKLDGLYEKHRGKKNVKNLGVKKKTPGALYASESILYCPSCKKELIPNSVYCRFCRTKVIDDGKTE